MRDLSISVRVLRRFVAKSTGLTLLPDFRKAYEALEKGDPDLMKGFGQSVQKIISPDGTKPVEWVWGLGTAKRNAINGLYKQISIFFSDASTLSQGDMLLPSILRDVGQWPKALRTLEIASSAAGEEREIKHGPFTVVPMPGITKAQTDQILSALDTASSKLRSVFPQVLYGKVYISTHLKSGTGAWYLATEDKFYVDIKVTASKDHDVHAIIHELGHRFDYKFLDASMRRAFTDLSTRKVYEKLKYDSTLREQVADEVVSMTKARALGVPLPKMSEELVLWLKTEYPTDPRKLTGDFLAGKIDEKELHAGIKGSKDAEVMTGRRVLRCDSTSLQRKVTARPT